MHGDFEQVAIDWVRFKRVSEGCSVYTETKYSQVLTRLSLLLKERRRDHLSATAEDLEEFCGAYLFKMRLSAKSRRVAVSCLRGFFEWMQKRGIRLDNPAADLRPPKAGRKLPRFMQLSDAEKLVHCPDTSTFLGVRDLAMLLVMMGTGVRVSGLCGLNESDLIWFADEKRREDLILRVRKKGGDEQYLPVPDDARLALRAYLGHPDLAVIDRVLENGDKVLFVSVAWRGVPLHEYNGEARRIAARSVQDMVMRYGLQAGISADVSHPHALRHLFATELVEDDVNMLTVQTAMGHARPDTTAIYTHTAMRKLGKEVKRAGPLAKIKTPLSGLAAALRKPAG